MHNMNLIKSILKQIRIKRLVILQIVLIILVGLLSRIVQLNNIIWDKYLGDMLYAVMFYYIFKLFIENHRKRLFVTFLLMVVFELIQLTGLPTYLSHTENFVFHILGFLIGSEFSFIDICVYIVGLSLLHLLKEFKSTITKDYEINESTEIVEIKDGTLFFQNINLLINNEKDYYLLLEDPSKKLQKLLERYHVDSAPDIKFGMLFLKSAKFMVGLNSEAQKLLIDFSKVRAAPEICTHLYLLKEEDVIADWYDFPFEPLCIYKDKVDNKRIESFVKSVSQS